jgi:aryl-alcohol dehydrogenase-like predicted oxidoreductase
MRYKLLGASGLRVSELALGTMTFGEEWGWGASKEESRAMFEAYAGAGGNFIDTANRYTEGTSERLVGELIAPDREHWVVATKYTLWMRRDDPNFSGNHRKNLIQALDASLERLGTEYVDLYWVHVWDFTTPIDEVMRALDDVVRAGKVLYVGVSDTPAWVVSRANTLAELRGWTRFVGLQLRYSLIDRTAERDLLPMARALDLAVTPWSVLGAGVLTGKYSRGERPDEGRAREGAATVERNLEIADAVCDVADEIGCTPGQVALSWVRQQPGVVIPLLGARNLPQLEDNLGCLNVELSADQLAPRQPSAGTRRLDARRLLPPRVEERRHDDCRRDRHHRGESPEQAVCETVEPVHRVLYERRGQPFQVRHHGLTLATHQIQHAVGLRPQVRHGRKAHLVDLIEGRLALEGEVVGQYPYFLVQDALDVREHGLHGVDRSP